MYFFRPVAITWWKDIKMFTDVGIIGTECGTVILINLLNGQQIGATHIDGSIHSLHVCQNENKEDASLLITSKLQQQWRLSLEQHKWHFSHNSENKALRKEMYTNGSIHDNIESSVSNKSKLRELKQLSVEKLAILKQKLIETKSQTLGESSQSNRENDNGTLVNSEILPEFTKFNFINSEPVSKDTFLSSQYDREGQQLYTCYHPVTNHITVRTMFLI